MAGYRPTDWHVLDLEKDPTPGDPDRVRSLAKSLHDFADDVQDALRLVKGMAEEEAVLTWVGKTAKVFQDEFSGVPKNLKKLKKSYDLAGDALAAYWPKLERAQSLADKALAKGREAQADLSSAKSRLSTADSWVTRANKEADKYKDDPTGGKDVEKPDEAKVRAATRDATNAESAQTSAQADVTSAQNALDAAKKMAEDARKMREDAAGEAKRKLDEASDAGIQNRKWYEEVGDWFSDNWDTIVAVCKVVVAVLGVIALIIGGPILGAIVLIAALVVLADTLNKYAKGQASLWDVAFAALDCIPGMKGLTTLGGLAKGLKTMGKTGLKGMAMGVKGLGKGARAMGRGMKKLFCRTDPVDVATGEVVMSAEDVALAGVFPLVLERHYRTSVRSGRWFGPSWASTIDQRLIIDQGGVRFTADDGMVLYYPVPDPDVPIEPVEGPRWQLQWDGTAAGTMTIHQPENGRTLYFRPLPGRPPAELPIAAIADRNGNAMRIEYGADGAPREVVHDGGYRVGLTVDQGRITALGLLSAPGQPTLLRYDYDAAGNLSAVYNSSGLPLKLDYDQQRRITRWEDRNGTWYGYRYDSAGRCIHAVGSDGILEYIFDYDERLNVTLVTDSLGFTTRYEFNDAYQLIRETDALGNSTVREWDRYDRVQSVVDPLGYQTSYEYDAGGNLATLTRSDGREIKAEYNALHLPEVVVGADGATWRNEYDARGNIVRSEDPAGYAKTFVYNAQGHLIESVNALGESLVMETNAAGLPLAITDPLGNTTAYSHDALGRVIRVKDPLEGVTTLAWSPEGKVVRRVSPDGAEENNAYDPEGNLSSHTDPAGGVTRFESSHFDRLAAKVNPDGTRYEFSYDTELQLRQVTNPAGLTWHYEYDATGGLVGERDFNGRLVSYARDAAGRLVSRTNGAGEVSHYTRDAFGNVVEQRNEHDGVGGVTRFAYDAANRMTSASNNSAVMAVQYDILGNVISETCNDRVTAYAYDQLGRRTQRTTPSGLVSSAAYDEAGRLATLGSPGQHIGFSYDALGRETQRQWGAGISLAQSWTDGHQLASQVLEAGAPSSSQPQPQPIRRERYFAYRADGHLTDIRDSHAGDQHFTLDQVGHVTAVQGQGWSEAYAHDANGNLTYATWEQESSSAQPNSLSTAPQNITYSGTLLRRSGRSVYEYDGQGRVIRHTRRLLSGGKRVWQFHWDADDRITSVVTPDGTNWRYLYDPLGRRIGKQQLDPNDCAVVQETTFTWDAGRIIEEETTRGSREDRHITTWDWAPDTYRPVAQTDRILPLADAPQEEIDQRFYAIVTDLVGAPTELVDDAGNVAWKSRATLWGANHKEQSNSVNCPLRFPGQYRDDETGLHYNNFRYYDPETAGYRSPDPLGLSASPNQHAYVPNPQTWADPLGLRCTPPSDAQLLADARTIHDAVRIGRSPIGARIAHQRMTVVTGDLNGELVYSVNHNMTAPAVRETAERLGYRRVNGIRYTGTNSTDAEQVMFNAIDAGDLPSTGRMAPSRPACGPERQDCRGRFDDYPDIRLIE